MKRTPLPPRKKRVKSRNVKRHTKNWLRAYGSPERVEWVKSQPCVITGRTPSENAHIETGGTGRKADYTKIVPLSTESHRVLHRVGRKHYEEFYEINLAELAAQTEAKWQEHNASAAA